MGRTYVPTVTWCGLAVAACLQAPSQPDTTGDGGTDAISAAADARSTDDCTFVDDFDGDALDSARWSRYTEVGGTIDVSGGALVLATDPPVDTYLYIHVMTVQSFAIPGSEAVADVGVSIEESGDSMMLWTNQDRWIGLGVDSGYIFAAMGDAGGTGTTFCDLCPQYDPALHRYWRMRADQNTLHFETSEDRTSWDALVASVALPFSSGQLRLWAESTHPGQVTTTVESLALAACAEIDKNRPAASW